MVYFTSEKMSALLCGRVALEYIQTFMHSTYPLTEIISDLFQVTYKWLSQTLQVHCNTAKQ
jgi:hypothetical protein